jgi:hypothetical protein
MVSISNIYEYIVSLYLLIPGCKITFGHGLISLLQQCASERSLFALVAWLLQLVIKLFLVYNRTYYSDVLSRVD